MQNHESDEGSDGAFLIKTEKRFVSVMDINLYSLKLKKAYMSEFRRTWKYGLFLANSGRLGGNFEYFLKIRETQGNFLIIFQW